MLSCNTREENLETFEHMGRQRKQQPEEQQEEEK